MIASERTPGIDGAEGVRSVKMVYWVACCKPATAVTATLNCPMPNARVKVRPNEGFATVTCTERAGSHEAHEAPEGNGVTIDA